VSAGVPCLDAAGPSHARRSPGAAEALATQGKRAAVVPAPAAIVRVQIHVRADAVATRFAVAAVGAVVAVALADGDAGAEVGPALDTETGAAIDVFAAVAARPIAAPPADAKVFGTVTVIILDAAMVAEKESTRAVGTATAEIAAAIAGGVGAASAHSVAAVRSALGVLRRLAECWLRLAAFSGGRAALGRRGARDAVGVHAIAVGGTRAAVNQLPTIVGDASAPTAAGRASRFRRAAGAVATNLPIGAGAAGDVDSALGDVATFARGTDRGAARAGETAGAAAAGLELGVWIAGMPLRQTAVAVFARRIAAAVGRVAASESGRAATDRLRPAVVGGGALREQVLAALVGVGAVLLQIEATGVARA
jgi:hypothetical protein